MLETPQIVQSPAELTAFIHLIVPRSEIQVVMGSCLHELRITVAAQEIAVTGPWFTHHLQMIPEVFDFEVCLPVAKPVESMGRVKPGHLPAATVARTVYHGPYEGLGAAWGEFIAWIAANGHKPRADLWERYLSGPESNSDPATFRTELNRPLEN